MFRERVRYALILMIELAQVCKGEEVELSSISEKYNLPASAFDDILEQLVAVGYITHSDSGLLLQIEPDKLSIWDIVESIDKNQNAALTQDETPLRTPTAIMVDKEIEVVLSIIRYRFKCHKLSAWSTKAGKMIYI